MSRLSRLLLYVLFALVAPAAACATSLAVHDSEACCTAAAPPLPGVDTRLPCHEPATSPALGCAMEPTDPPAHAASVSDCSDDCRQCPHHHGWAPSALLAEAGGGHGMTLAPYEAPFYPAALLPKTRSGRLERPPSLAI